MGSMLSAIVIAAKVFLGLASLFSSTLDRFKRSPEIPVPNPTRSFWMDEEEDFMSSKELPEYADIIIIGSGISGTSAAYNLLSRLSTSSSTIGSVVMLEARAVCSGATGRNGGHIKADDYSDYEVLKEYFGKDAAMKVLDFRRSALKDLMEIDQECCGGQGQVRAVETLNCFFGESQWEKAKKKLAVWRGDMGEVTGKFTHEVFEGEEARKKFSLSKECSGVILKKTGAGAAHPYRLITSTLSYLLSTYSALFQIYPHTPVLRIEKHLSSRCYTLETPRGTIQTPRIIHATNAWVSHLLPVLRGKILPVRVTMSAQRPGLSLPSLDGLRSWDFVYPGGFDWTMQLPGDHGEIMFGGGNSFASNVGMDEIGLTDDSIVSSRIESYLSGALPLMFGTNNWGVEGRPSEKEEDEDGGWGQGRVKATWSGIMSYSTDRSIPWAGPLTEKMTSRAKPAGGGEWLACGYSGEGMVNAWGCGRAVAMTVLGLEEREGEKLPKEFWITEEKLKRSKAGNLFDSINRG